MARIAGGTGPREGRALRRLLALAVAASLRAAGRAVRRQRHRHRHDPRKGFHYALRRLAQGFELAGARRVHFYGEIDLAPVDHDLGDKALRDEVRSRVGAFDALERFEHALFGELFGHEGYVFLLLANTNCLVPADSLRCHRIPLLPLRERASRRDLAAKL